jgi:glycerol-3-phosphate dehydrogenase
MIRGKMIQELENQSNKWDLVIIGGGATGIGAAIEARSRGLKTLLLEQFDFSKGTSSRSTKLVHGGVRYLAQGNLALVKEALRERGRMKKNAPHLVKDQSFIIPNYKWWGVPFYTIGLVLYDLLSGPLSLGKSRPFSKARTLKKIPTLISKNLYGGVIYHDGQFDDSRMAINMVQTFVEIGGVAINYLKVTSLIKSNGKISGVESVDRESGKTYEITCKAVLNATGVFVDDIRKMDDPQALDMVCVSQGVHLVIDREFVPGNYAIMIPKTSDGRVLFAVPWHNKVVVGTTDIQKKNAEIEPIALDEEIDFILETAGRFLTTPPKRSDVRSVFAGLRPLAAPKGEGKNTKEISRGHIIKVSDSGLITITGGKWTTYRQMAQDVIDILKANSDMIIKESQTNCCKIHGYKENVDLNNPFYYYGTDEEKMLDLINENKEFGEHISNDLGIIKAQVVWSVRHEMARTIEDFLARRTRALFLNAKESVRIAPFVAEIMAYELNKKETWVDDQLAEYTALAKKYILQ